VLQELLNIQFTRFILRQNDSNRAVNRREKEEIICFKFYILFNTSCYNKHIYMTQLVQAGNMEDSKYKGTTTSVFMLL